MAGAPVQIRMVNPPVVPEEGTDTVVVTVASIVGHGQIFKVVARQYSDEGEIIIATAQVNSSGGDVGIAVPGAGVGAVELRVETEDGQQLSQEVYLLVAPPVVAQEMVDLFRMSKADLQRVRGPAFVDPELSWSTWAGFFHKMVVNFATVLSDPTDDSDEAYYLVTQLVEYFLVNGKYQTGQYLLKVAAAAGRQITVNGEQIDMDNVNLESLHRNRNPRNM